MDEAFKRQFNKFVQEIENPMFVDFDDWIINKSQIRGILFKDAQKEIFVNAGDTKFVIKRTSLEEFNNLKENYKKILLKK